MIQTSVYGAMPQADPRAITIFFGLGIPKYMQDERFASASPLAPLQPFADKLTMFTNVEMTESGDLAHPHGGTTVFVGAPPPNSKGGRAGGPSIDQFMKNRLYKNGVGTPLDTIHVGSFFRRSHGLYQKTRVWTESGAPAMSPLENPSHTFDAIFGKLIQAQKDADKPKTQDPEKARRQALRLSILDSVLQEYKHYTSEASNLSKASRARIREHFDKIRAYEIAARQEAAADGKPTATPAMCSVPGKQNPPGLPYGLAGQTARNAPKVKADDFSRAFRMNVDLFVLGMICDQFRFGNIMFESSGGHTRFDGTYRFKNHSYKFRDDISAHENWHQNRKHDMRWHAHYFQSNIAYALQRLNQADTKIENGKTLLDAAMVMVGTEVGENHNMHGVFHALSGCDGRLKQGGFYNKQVHAVDIYNTVTSAYGITEPIGTQNRTYRKGNLNDLKK
ncbi:MAG: DUF1552 domain-containing protein [Zetaproteobacteria bacterium]|nr:DUF1552 domain-containing protein [Zetaproteobacteria bacterium]